MLALFAVHAMPAPLGWLLLLFAAVYLSGDCVQALHKPAAKA